MKIISWNCNMAYARKQKDILAFQPDILILQECSQKDIQAAGAPFSHWIGNNPLKGLGILGFGMHSYALDASYTDDYPWFLPIRVDNKPLHILGVWAHVKQRQERYVRITHKAIDSYKLFLEKEEALIIGDLNSNAIWDTSHPGRSHSDLVEKLKQLDMTSVYHYQTQEVQGREKVPTYYQYRHKDKGYHLDYAFLSNSLLKTTCLSIPDAAFWLTRSDHIPLILDIAGL